MGVYWNKQNERWAVQRVINGVKVYGGLCDDEEDAARASDRLARNHENFKGRLNFSEEKVEIQREKFSEEEYSERSSDIEEDSDISEEECVNKQTKSSFNKEERKSGTMSEESKVNFNFSDFC